MDVHFLNGDAMTDRMLAAGFSNLLVCRECLIDGPVKASNIDAFWDMRAAFLEDEASYRQHVVTEFEKLQQLPGDAPVHLWFGDDLFCQANMWFTINFLQQYQPSLPVYRVFPKVESEAKRWQEYGGLSANDFKDCYAARERFTGKDLQLAVALWKAYEEQDLSTLQTLSHTNSPCFRYLDEVVQAHVDRYPTQGLGRPQRVLKEIIQSGVTDFNNVFATFYTREAIYGFGDDQVRDMLERIP